jgi:hypothetical protein
VFQLTARGLEMGAVKGLAKQLIKVIVLTEPALGAGLFPELDDVLGRRAIICCVGQIGASDGFLFEQGNQLRFD